MLILHLKEWVHFFVECHPFLLLQQGGQDIEMRHILPSSSKTSYGTFEGGQDIKMKRITSPSRTPYGRPFGKYAKLSSEPKRSGGFPNVSYHVGDDHVTTNIPDDYISRASRFKPSQLLTRARNLGRVARSYFPVRYSKGEPLISGGVSKTRSVRAFIKLNKGRL